MTSSHLNRLRSLARLQSQVSSVVVASQVDDRVSPTTLPRTRHPLDFLRSRLSRRIVLSVFSSIVAIEAIILIPSVHKYERDLLQHLSEQSSASLSGALSSLSAHSSLTPQQLLQQITPLQALPLIAGGSLYRKTGPDTGAYLGHFGEAPQLTYNPGQNITGHQFNRRNHRYDSIWTSPLIGDYLIIINHDAQAVRGQVLAYIGRILGLVLLISGVVTLSTMIVLRSLLITPILALRSDLLRAAPAALRDRDSVPTTFDSTHYRRADELGEVIGAFEQMFDHITSSIAQRQRTEAQLRESETRFRLLVQQAAESILVVNHDGIITDINAFALRYLHYSSEELLHQSIFDITPQLTREAYQQQWQMLHKGEPITFETIHRRKYGQTYPVEVRSSLIQRDGQEYVLSLARDISDRKKAEAAQARLAEIGELAAMIVHEVRNPLATIYMALSGFGKLNLPRSGQLRLELAMEEAERLKRLLNEILTYSREQRLAGEGVEINDLCQTLYQSLHQLPTAQGRTIHLKPCSEKLIVNGDRDKLKQVFINLVTNACEAIALGDTVRWTIQPLSSQVKVQVQNGGEPIPPDVLPKLTQPFVSTKEGGNGLGLAITKRIIQAHGGSFTITSNADQGTVVSVVLPITEPRSQES